jgi:hypothetical protein
MGDDWGHCHSLASIPRKSWYRRHAGPSHSFPAPASTGSRPCPLPWCPYLPAAKSRDRGSKDTFTLEGPKWKSSILSPTHIASKTCPRLPTSIFHLRCHPAPHSFPSLPMGCPGPMSSVPSGQSGAVQALQEPCSKGVEKPRPLHCSLHLDAIRGNQPKTLRQLLPQDYSQPAKGIRVVIQSLDL